MHRKQQGMSLLEVVVSMLLCGIGLAITVGMYQASLRHAQQAEYRAVAMREAQVLVDEMRANKLGAAGFLQLNSETGYDNSFDKSDDNKAKIKSILCVGKTKETECNKAVDDATGEAKKYVVAWNDALKTKIPTDGLNVKLEWGGDNQKDKYTLSIKWKTTVDKTAQGNGAAVAPSENDAVVMQFVL